MTCVCFPNVISNIISKNFYFTTNVIDDAKPLALFAWNKECYKFGPSPSSSIFDQELR